MITTLLVTGSVVDCVFIVLCSPDFVAVEHLYITCMLCQLCACCWPGKWCHTSGTVVSSGSLHLAHCVLAKQEVGTVNDYYYSALKRH